MKLPSKSWLVPAAIGVGIGWLLSGTISKLIHQTGLPIHAMQGRVARPRIMPHPVPHASGGGGGGIQGISRMHPSTTHFVPVRRSFDRSYDSWLHTTVNALPPVG